MRGGDRLHFHVRMPHGIAGIIVHPTPHHPSIEVMQVDRPQVLARSETELTGILSTELQAAISRFIQEQSWEGIIVSLGDPRQSGDVHHAMPSKMAKDLLEKGKQLETEGFKADDSPRKMAGAKGIAHIETPIEKRANEVDIGLRAAPVVAEFARGMPQMIKSLEANISTAAEKRQREQVAEMERAVGEAMESRLNEHLKSVDAVVAHAMSGTTFMQTTERLLNVMGNLFAKQGEQDKEIRGLKQEITELRRGRAGKSVRQTELPL
jgi:hypothetical protein